MKTEQEYLDQAQPCPFCGSHDLTTSSWACDDGEYTAIACKGCLAEAPATTWNDRHDWKKQTLIHQLGNSEIPEHLKNL